MKIRTLTTKALAAGLAFLALGAAARPASAAVRFSLCAGESRSFCLAPSSEAAGAPPSQAGLTTSLMPKKWRRSLVQLGALAAYSTYRYWKAYHEWIEDWQFDLTFADQYRRFLTTEAIRFDSNAYLTNWTHVVGGALYYQFARTNYLTWGQSFLTAFAGSAFYEYVSEWREVISVNDMFLTTFGGYSVGETWFQLSDYFHHSKSFPLRVLGFMNPINELNQWLDRKNPASRVYAGPSWAGLVLSAGWFRSSETGRRSYDAGRISFETQLILTPEYGRPGTLKKVQRDTTLSELDITVVLRPRAAADTDLRNGWDQEVDLFARTVGLSWYRQSIDELGRGSALSVGLGSALTYLRKRPTVYDVRGVQVHIAPLPETPTDFRDKMTVAHLAGPVVDWTRFGRKVKVRAVADAYVDFAMLGSFAFNAYSAVLPIDGMKTTLCYYGYHYAYGASASGRVDVNWGAFWVRGLFSAHAWHSWRGLDRYESGITNNVDPVDTRTRYLVQAGWRLGSWPVRAFAGIEGVHRWGRIAEITASSQDTRTFAGLSYLF